MKTYQLRYLDTLDSEIAVIEEYLEKQFVSPGVVLTPIFDQIEKDLPTSPYMYPVYQDDPRFRKMVVEKYLVFYVIKEEQQTVEIHHILHGMRNIKWLLQEESSTT